MTAEQGALDLRIPPPAGTVSVPKARVLEAANRMWATRPEAAQILTERAAAYRDGELVPVQEHVARRYGMLG